nr:hypothetical protein CFP56_72335 [Quercus suber]
MLLQYLRLSSEIYPRRLRSAQQGNQKIMLQRKVHRQPALSSKISQRKSGSTYPPIRAVRQEAQGNVVGATSGVGLPRRTAPRPGDRSSRQLDSSSLCYQHVTFRHPSLDISYRLSLGYPSIESPNITVCYALSIWDASHADSGCNDIDLVTQYPSLHIPRRGLCFHKLPYPDIRVNTGAP